MYDAHGKLDKGGLVENYAPLVKRIAYQLMSRLPASVDVDDLIQNGMMGLLDALGRYEQGLGAQFETYAVQRIRGAMLDGLRENDWLPRSLRRDMRRIEAAIHSLDQRNGRPPSETELAAALDLPLEDYQRMLQDARGHQLVYLEDFNREEDDDYLDRHLAQEGNDPLTLLEDTDLRRRLVGAIEHLPERARLPVQPPVEPRPIAAQRFLVFRQHAQRKGAVRCDLLPTRDCLGRLAKVAGLQQEERQRFGT